MSAQENKAIVRHYTEELFNKGNLAAAEEIFAPNWVSHDLAKQGLPPGPEGMKQYISMLRLAFPDLDNHIEDQIAEGDKVVSRNTARGTHKGNFMGIAPTNKQMTTTAIVIDRFANGKIVETWVNIDMLGALQQLGVVPPMGQPKE